jgi:hypothetical protein
MTVGAVTRRMAIADAHRDAVPKRTVFMNASAREK